MLSAANILVARYLNLEVTSTRYLQFSLNFISIIFRARFVSLEASYYFLVRCIL
jgi:hypothetical protein